MCNLKPSNPQRMKTQTTFLCWSYQMLWGKQAMFTLKTQIFFALLFRNDKFYRKPNQRVWNHLFSSKNHLRKQRLKCNDNLMVTSRNVFITKNWVWFLQHFKYRSNDESREIWPFGSKWIKGRAWIRQPKLIGINRFIDKAGLCFRFVSFLSL